MTRQEFIDGITDWLELIDFCRDENCEDIIDDVYDSESYNEEIDYSLQERVHHQSWYGIWEWLDSLPIEHDYYIQDRDGDWYGADDDDFDALKDEVIEYMDDEGLWDDEEEVYEENIDPEDVTPVEEEDVPLTELFDTCNSEIQKIENDRISNAIAAEKSEEMAFDELCVSAGIKYVVERSN